MTVEESLALLKLAPGCSHAEIEQAYQVASDDLSREIESAPTPALKERYRRKLQDLDTARSTIKPQSATNLPKVAASSHAPAHSSPGGTIQSTQRDSSGAASVPPANSGGKKTLILAAGLALLSVGIGTAFLSKGKQPDSPRNAATEAGKAPAAVAPSASSPANSKVLAVTTERQEYHNGEDVVCLVDIPFDGHLRVYSIDVTGRKIQIFPNGFEPDGAVRGGTKVRIPGQSSYTLKLDLPPGTKKGDEKVVAVLSPTKFQTGSSPDSSNPFPIVETTSDLKTRGLSLQAAGDAATGTGSYRVTE